MLQIYYLGRTAQFALFNVYCPFPFHSVLLLACVLLAVTSYLPFSPFSRSPFFTSYIPTFFPLIPLCSYINPFLLRFILASPIFFHFLASASLFLFLSLFCFSSSSFFSFLVFLLVFSIPPFPIISSLHPRSFSLIAFSTLCSRLIFFYHPLNLFSPFSTSPIRYFITPFILSPLS